MKEELGHCSVNQYRYILRNKRHQSPCNPFPIPFAWGCSGVHRITGGTASESVASQKATCSSSPPLPTPTTSDHRRLPLPHRADPSTRRHRRKLPATPKPPSISGAAGFRSPPAASLLLPEPGGCREEDGLLRRVRWYPRM